MVVFWVLNKIFFTNITSRQLTQKNCRNFVSIRSISGIFSFFLFFGRGLPLFFKKKLFLKIFIVQKQKRVLKGTKKYQKFLGNILDAKDYIFDHYSFGTLLTKFLPLLFHHSGQNVNSSINLAVEHFSGKKINKK